MREVHTEAMAQVVRRPSASMRSTTDWAGTEWPTTVPSPDGVDTHAPIGGAFAAKS